MQRVIFVQLPPPRFSFEEAPSNIPLAPGFLVAALDAAHVTGVSSEILEPDIADVFADHGLAAAVVGTGPAIVAMTLYVWNVQRSLFLASNIKRRRPETFIVVGGPEVTPDNAWVMEHPAVDAGVFGEGESRIATLVCALLNSESLTGIPGIFFKDRGSLRTNGGPIPVWDLGTCAYPYLDGTIGPSRDGTLFLETMRGCPFRCRYCYYHKAFPELRFHPEGSVKAALDFAYSRDSRVKEIYLMDPTFNARMAFRELLQEMAQRRRIRDIAVHTELRADLLSPGDVDLLEDAGLKSAEVGLQTVNNAALKAAGRSGNPDKTAGGALMLKEAGIEVTTGIILGLPKDTPEGFARTLEWLKRTGAYSVVHPFVLSILPGTDFRANAAALGVEYDKRPPYHVRTTSTFHEGDIRNALFECERMFDMELDHIPRPSLVDQGPVVISRVYTTPYISKWIVDAAARSSWEKLLPVVCEKATDPFVLWFRNHYAEEAMLKILGQFVLSNPHTVLSIVLEFSEPPGISFFDRALHVVAEPALYVNRSYRPLYGERSIVSPDFTVILGEEEDSDTRKRMAEEYVAFAVPVWETMLEADRDYSQVGSPVLLSGPMPRSRTICEALFDRLEKSFGDHPEDVLFRDWSLQQAWTRRTRSADPAILLPERILVSS